MSNLIPFDASGKLPAHLKAFATEGNEFGSSAGVGFPVISIKGKVFTINRGGEKTLVTKPGTDDEPAAALEVVILGHAPKVGYAKTFYANGFVEGGNAKPDCYSDDGISPAKDAADPQGSKCALCPQNAVGSGANGQNPKAKACRASKLLAVAPAGQINDPMLLRVPGTSVIPLSDYGDYLAKRGSKAAAVVTKISFDYTKAYPSLTFKALGHITPEMAPEVTAQIGSVTVRAICGDKTAKPVVEAVEDDSEYVAPPKIEAPKPAAKKAAPAPAVVEEDDDDLPVTPKAKVKVEEEVKTVRKAAPKADVSTDEGLDSALDALDFED